MSKIDQRPQCFCQCKDQPFSRLELFLQKDTGHFAVFIDDHEVREAPGYALGDDPLQGQPSSVVHMGVWDYCSQLLTKPYCPLTEAKQRAMDESNISFIHTLEYADILGRYHAKTGYRRISPMPQLFFLTLHYNSSRLESNATTATRLSQQWHFHFWETYFPSVCVKNKNKLPDRFPHKKTPK